MWLLQATDAMLQAHSDTPSASIVPLLKASASEAAGWGAVQPRVSAMQHTAAAQGHATG